MPSDRELYRRLWDNPMLREIRDIEDRERPHHSSQITRFLMNISPERLSGIIDGLVGELWREASSMGRRWRAGDIIVIASGGGSIPVIEDGEGHYEGVEAVIDKDLAGEVLAEVIKADIFLILTDVENVKLNFGKSDEKNIDEMTVEEAELFHEEGYFLPGGMGPKVKACIRFLNHGKAGHHHIISKGFRSLKRRKWN
jgi:acetylglutamate kinase